MLTLALLAQPQQLISAVRGGLFDTAHVLLAAGADPNASGGDGEPALDLAVFADRADLATLLLSFNARVNALWGGSTALDFAAARGDAATARLLIDNGADVRRVYPSGRTPLHIAARNHHAEAGANPLIENSDGLSPLENAVRLRRPAMLRAMLAEAPNPPPSNC